MNFVEERDLTVSNRLAFKQLQQDISKDTVSDQDRRRKKRKPVSDKQREPVA